MPLLTLTTCGDQKLFQSQNLYKKQVQLAPVVHLSPFDRSGQQFDDACIKAGSIVGEDYFVVKIASGGFSSNLKVKE